MADMAIWNVVVMSQPVAIKIAYLRRRRRTRSMTLRDTLLLRQYPTHRRFPQLRPRDVPPRQARAAPIRLLNDRPQRPPQEPIHDRLLRSQPAPRAIHWACEGIDVLVEP